MASARSNASRWKLAVVVERLAKIYGRPRKPRITDPFEMILWESCAYLVDDTKRAEVFRSLKTKVGLAPRAIVGAPDAVLLDAIQGSGMRPPDRAERLRECAEIAESIGLEALRRAARKDPVAARKLLKKFPGVADPGADRILLFNRSLVTLAPESNGLRVLVRLGFGKKERDYSKTYRVVAEAVARELPADFGWLVAAHQLLRRHGQEMCKRNHPLCETCPLSARCEAFRTKSFAFF
jgi:endonuclease III